MILMRWEGESNTCVLRDDGGDLSYTKRNCSVVVTSIGGWDHETTDVSDFGVVKNALKAVAYLDASLAWCHDQDHQDAAVIFITDAPFVLQLGRKLLN